MINGFGRVHVQALDSLSLLEVVNAQPVGDEPDFVVGQYFFYAKRRHAIVVVRVKLLVLGIFHEINDPLA